MNIKEGICTGIGVIGSIIASAFGGWDTGLVTLLIFMGIDYFSGYGTVKGCYRHSPLWKIQSFEADGRSFERNQCCRWTNRRNEQGFLRYPLNFSPIKRRKIDVGIISHFSKNGALVQPFRPLDVPQPIFYPDFSLSFCFLSRKWKNELCLGRQKFVLSWLGWLDSNQRDDGVKVRCLTSWLQPNKKLKIQHCISVYYYTKEK